MQRSCSEIYWRDLVQRLGEENRDLFQKYFSRAWTLTGVLLQRDLAQQLPQRTCQGDLASNLLQRPSQRGYLATIFLMIDDRSLICGTNEIFILLARSLYAEILLRDLLKGSCPKTGWREQRSFSEISLESLNLNFNRGLTSKGPGTAASTENLSRRSCSQSSTETFTKGVSCQGIFDDRW